MNNNIVSAQELRCRKPTDAQRLEKYVGEQFENQSIHVGFDADVEALAEQDVLYGISTRRKDLRGLPCFTIDCADTKDMDDAVSLQREEDGWCLGVHIADVAEFAPFMSELDTVAKERGTSIYLPNVTVPMLPPVLSNDLCSLVPQAERKAISVFIHLDELGNVRSFQLTKSLIRSRLKGTYNQVNRLLSRKASRKIAAKYAAVEETLRQMELLAGILRSNRLTGGARICDEQTHKFKFVNGAVDISIEERGVAEGIVEEFMVLANEQVAKYCVKHGLPLVRRSHLRENTCAFYGLGDDGHAALALKDYAHFTSPIRRLADLKVHQVLTAYLNGASAKMIHMMFDAELRECAEIATKRARRANGVQKCAENFCKILYFFARRGREFTGTVYGSDSCGKTTILVDELKVLVTVQRQCQEPEGKKVSFKVYANPDEHRMHAYGVCAA